MWWASSAWCDIQTKAVIACKKKKVNFEPVQSSEMITGYSVMTWPVMLNVTDQWVSQSFSNCCTGTATTGVPFSSQKLLLLLPSSMVACKSLLCWPDFQQTPTSVQAPPMGSVASALAYRSR